MCGTNLNFDYTEGSRKCSARNNRRSGMAQRVSAITNEVQIPFHHGMCPESANSALVAFHSNGADSLHGHAPQDIPKRLSERQAKKIMAMAASSNSAVADKVVVQLRNQNLWKSFRKEETEMIITKTGRFVSANVVLTSFF